MTQGTYLCTFVIPFPLNNSLYKIVRTAAQQIVLTLALVLIFDFLHLKHKTAYNENIKHTAIICVQK